MHWDDATKRLTLANRSGNGFPGMLASRTFNIVLVNEVRGMGDAHATNYSATLQYDGTETSVTLKEVFTPGEREDVTSTYIINPSFEDYTKGWTRDINTTWSGINTGGGNGDPVATDGTHIFGVWDATAGKRAKISQVITLPKGNYCLTVDMHASDNGNKRVGDQHIFAGDQKALFRDQVLSAGRGDNVPMQTLTLEFGVENDGTNVEIGVNETEAPQQTWYKVDNFRLYRIVSRPTLKDITDGIQAQHTSLDNGHIRYYSTNGVHLNAPQRGINIIQRGDKVRKVLIR